MPSSLRSRTVDICWLLLILAAAAGARAGYLLGCADAGQNDGPFLVQKPFPELAELAGNIRDNRDLAGRAPLASASERTAHVAPAYPWLVALLELLPTEPMPAVRWIQCVLGSLTAALYYLFCRRTFPGRLTAILAGLATAGHPFWIADTAILADGVLCTFLLAGCLWLGIRGAQVGGALTSLLLGVGLAGMVLVRAALGPFALAALLWYLLRCRRLAGGWQAALLAFLGFGTALTPWTLRNLEFYGDFIPVVDSAWYHLWVGNNPRATGGPLPDAVALEALAASRGETMQETQRHLDSLPQPARYHALAPEVLAALTEDPAAALQRRIWAGLYFFFGADWFNQQRLWQPGPAAAVPPVAEAFFTIGLPASLLAMLLFAALGWRWSLGCPSSGIPASLAVFWIPFPYLLGHAGFLSGPRLPLDGVFLCYGAFALVCLIRLGLPQRKEAAPDAPPAAA